MSFVPRLRALASEVDPTATVTRPVALHEVFSFDLYMVKWIKLGVVILVGILLTLSASGIYALMSFTVSERTREVGVRTALGAQRSSIALTIAKRALGQLLVGVLLGMGAALVVLYGLLHDGGKPPEFAPFAYAVLGGIAIAVLIGLLACVAPTARALRIMPTEALRSEG